MSKPKLPWVRMVCYLPVSMALCLGGLGLLATIVPFTSALGFLCLWSSGYPYARWLSRHIKATVAYEEKTQPESRGRKPKRAEDLYDVPSWEEPDAIDFELLDIIVNNGGRNGNVD